MDDKRIKQVIEKSVDKEISSGGNHTPPPPIDLRTDGLAEGIIQLLRSKK